LGRTNSCRKNKVNLSLDSADLAARAAFLARGHRSESLDEWLTHVIRERVELEEAAFVGAKQELVTREN
jgi:predicted component of type VI protein secretion system